jgi:N-acetylmuramoyl-L-alanine amidase
MTVRAVVANMRVHNRRIEEAVTLLDSLDADLVMACEAQDFHDVLGRAGVVYGRTQGTRGARECVVVVNPTRVQVERSETIQLTDDVGGPPGHPQFWQDRHATLVWCRVDGRRVLAVSWHGNAGIQNGLTGQVRDTPGSRQYAAGMHKLAGILETEQAAGWMPLVGADANYRRRAPLWQHSPFVVLGAMRFKAHGVDQLAYHPKGHKVTTSTVVKDPPGCDHDWLNVTLHTIKEVPVRGFAPFATVRNIPPGPNDPPITPRLAILHVDAGNADSLYDYFNGPSGGVESHFFVKRDGEIEQYRSIYFQADANLGANGYAVSIETQGYGAGEWTKAQLASIKRLLTWLHDTADIPLRKVKRPEGSGVGYHVQFGAPGPWTPVAKTCPGPDRIKQFDEILVPWMRRQDQPDRQNRVERARALIAEAMDLLEATPTERVKVHAALPELAAIYDRLPEK